jgi:hypothetical protein
MSLNAVQQAVRDTINGTSSSYLPNLTAYVAPPSLSDLGAPKAFVWGAVFSEKRWTMSAGRYDGDQNYIASSGGNKKVDHQLFIWLSVVVKPDDPHADEAFPILLENVLKALRATPKVQNIVDPSTGQKSTMMNLGEEFHVEYSTPRTTADQRLVRVDARITCMLFEMISV